MFVLSLWVDGSWLNELGFDELGTSQSVPAEQAMASSTALQKQAARTDRAVGGGRETGDRRPGYRPHGEARGECFVPMATGECRGQEARTGGCHRSRCAESRWPWQTICASSVPMKPVGRRTRILSKSFKVLSRSQSVLSKGGWKCGKAALSLTETETPGHMWGRSCSHHWYRR